MLIQIGGDCFAKLHKHRSSKDNPFMGSYTSVATANTSISTGGGFTTSTGVATNSITFPSPSGSFAAGTVKIYGVN